MKPRPGTLIRLLLIVLVALVLVSMGAQAALAATPNDVQYNKVKGQTEFRPPKTKPAPLGTAKASGTLPFTGVDLAIVSVGGALVLAGGLGLRRFGRKSSDQS